MDIHKIIQELHEERARLDQVIQSLESLSGEENSTGENRVERRGRKSMSQAERLQVSQRMRKYWASRRNK